MRESRVFSGAMFLFTFAAGNLAANGQSVIFPQITQAETASGVTDDAAGTIVLSNNLLTATFVNEDGVLKFGGSPQLGLLPGTELFTITLGDEKTKVGASEMTLRNWSLQALEATPDAPVASERFAGQCVKATLAYGDMTFEWRAVLRDGSHYLRTELEITSDKDVAMHKIVPMVYEMKAETAPEVIGNTRGAILASDKIFAGLETPTGINAVESLNVDIDNVLTADPGFAVDSWKRDTTGDSQPASPAYWTWEPGEQTPAGVLALGFTTGDIRGKRGFAEFSQKGTYKASFRYQEGTHGLNIIGVDIVDVNGEVVASDYHIGFTGGVSRNNEFTLDVPGQGVYLLRYFVEIKTETVTANGEINWSPAVTPAQKPTVPSTGSENDNVMVTGTWSRHTTLEAGKVWKVGAVVGIIAPGQARRSFLSYSERERAVPWRPFPIYNSWYELNIDRNNSLTYHNHMTADDCEQVVNQWHDNLYKAYGSNIEAFVWDDGWDQYGTWTFNKNFPDGFSKPDKAATLSGAGTGAWLGPVGGYGVSGEQRRNYWKDKGGMQLSNPAYYKVFLDACQNMIDNYDFRFFKLDGISAQSSSVGPDAGYVGEENAEGIIDIMTEVRKMRPDMFFNTTVGTWASPFWFHYTDAVWRQEADWSTIGTQGDDRERWITYRDRLVYQNFVQNSPLCPINTLMTHGVILTKFGDVSKTMDYDGIVRELRCAFACGSGMVELYCDSELLNTINNGALWGDIAECIEWQRANADVLPDIHWVGGNPWNGRTAEVYGWASWNGQKATLALRNPQAMEQSYTFTLREALEIPEYFTDKMILTPSFDSQNDLAGLPQGEVIDLDTPITVSLPASSVFVFDGTHDLSVSISGIVTDAGKQPSADNRVFDLNGREHNPANLAPGIYVRNGEKVIVR